MGIRAPSLYKHIRDKQALQAALISDAFERWADRFERALAQADDPLAALASEYRSFALDHPHVYRLMNERPLSRDRLVAGVEERAAAPVIRSTGGDPDLARAPGAFAHGMTILELNDRFPPGADLGAAWRCGIDAFRKNAPRRSNKQFNRGVADEHHPAADQGR